MKILVLTAILALTIPLLAAPAALAGPNPFTSPPADGQDLSQAEDGDAPLLAPVLKRILRWQSALRQGMSKAALSMRENPLGSSFWLFMALALAYGAVHALGPGHGKVLAASYFLHRGGGPRQALAFGYLTMFLHVLSATTLVLGGRLLLEASASRFVDDTGAFIQDVSYALLLAVGLVMLTGSVRRCRRKRTKDDAPPAPDRRSLAGLALAAGIVPCPGAALVLIFAISLDALAAGLAAMVAISLGMGLSLSAVGMAASSCRGVVLGMMQGRERLHRAGHCLFSLAGSLAVTLMGGLLLLGSLAG